MTSVLPPPSVHEVHRSVTAAVKTSRPRGARRIGRVDQVLAIRAEDLQHVVDLLRASPPQASAFTASSGELNVRAEASAACGTMARRRGRATVSPRALRPEWTKTHVVM